MVSCFLMKTRDCGDYMYPIVGAAFQYDVVLPIVVPAAILAPLSVRDQHPTAASVAGTTTRTSL